MTYNAPSEVFFALAFAICYGRIGDLRSRLTTAVLALAASFWPKQRERMDVHDFHATMLRLLGLDHTRLTTRFQGRDFRLTDVSGRVIEKVLA